MATTQAKSASTKTTTKSESTVKKSASKPAPKNTKPASAATATKIVKTAPEKVATSVTHKSATPASSNIDPKMKKSYIILGAVIVLLGIGLFLGRGLFVAAVVNGQPISRLEVVQQTEKQRGKQTLSTLVRNTLIEQEARRQNVTVNDDEINAEIKKLEENMKKQGQKLDDVLALQEMTRDDLNKLIRLDKLVSKLVGKDVTVTDKEVDEYIEKNKDALPEGQDQAKLKKDIKESLKQQKTTEKVSKWLADLEKKAKVSYFVQY